MTAPKSVPTPEFSVGKYGTRAINITLEGKVLDLGTTEYVDFLGANSTLTDCRIKLHSGKAIAISKATFLSCRFIAMGKQHKDAQWRDVRLDNCTFEGVFRFWSVFPDYFDRSFPMQIKECDFSKARLDYCTFCDIDWESCKPPEKPHVIFLSPNQHKADVLRLSSDLFINSFLQMVTMVDVGVSAFSLKFLDEPRKRFNRAALAAFLDVCRSSPFVRINF